MIGNIVRTCFRRFNQAGPLKKGMISYAIIWPSSCMAQQFIEGKNFRSIDWWRVLRFSVFGTFYVAPTLYCWVRVSSAMWPAMDLKTGLLKAILEQISYGPFAGLSFFYVMSLLEFKCMSDAVAEVREKFWPTYKVGVCIWPILQTINFALIPEQNRIVFVSLCSLLWTTFLAYIKYQESKESEGILEPTKEPNK